MFQSSFNELAGKIRFITLHDGTVLYKPIFGKSYFVIKSQDESEKIIRYSKIRQEKLSAFFAFFNACDFFK